MEILLALDCICVAKTNALISCAITAQLICVFVFTYMQKSGFLMTWLISENSSLTSVAEQNNVCLIWLVT